MPHITLEGDTLGEKHKCFNKLVKDAIADKQLNLTNIDSNDGDIDNLLKIDIACKTQNVDYILNVWKSNDMLYVSKAIKQSTWLITEQEFAHIVNPEYLFTHLFPHMLTKAINKLLLHIRLHLKDAKRIETFYNYLKNDDRTNKSVKWLLNCSVLFIENEIQNLPDITLHLFKRLCKRSVKFLKFHTKVADRSNRYAIKSVLFLLKSDTEEYLNVLEGSKDYSNPTFGQKQTKIVMKKFPNRILDNFEIYMDCVDVPTLTKYMKEYDVKNFVLKHVKNINTRYFLCNYDNLKHFIKIVPKEDRFEFAKKMYVDKNVRVPAAFDNLLCFWDFCSESEDTMPSSIRTSYNYYQYAPFGEAFVELKKLVRAENSPDERCTILSGLLACAKNNPQNIKTTLQYYYDKHRNEPLKFKLQFVNNLIRQVATYEFDSDTWNILDKLFYSLEVYTESETNVQTCLKAIVLYKVLHDETIPDIVEKKLTFETFKEFQNKLKTEQQSKLFKYLLSYMSNKIQNNTIKSESDVHKTIRLITDVLKLLVDWKKDLKYNEFILVKIQKLIQLNTDNEWNINLTSLYKLNKSFRRHMFEESILLHPCEEVCLNALKHDPQLLTRYSDKLDGLRSDNAVSLQRLLAKLRIYWQHSLAQEWTDTYMNSLSKSTGHKPLIRGLFTLLPPEELKELATKYSPKAPHIDWNEVDQVEISIRKNIAQNLYVARPLIPLDVVLLYAKGYYLQYAVPSLNSIIYNINNLQSQELILKLLEAPILLQKYGLHLAFMTLKYKELKPLFVDIWKSTKNSKIRTHIFKYTYKLLCKVKDSSLVKELWELLSMFIDNLGIEENKTIFSKLGKPKNVPVSVQGEFFEKSFNFLSSLPPAAGCDSYKDNLISYAPDIMDLLDSDFVASKMLAPLKEEMSKSRTSSLIDLMSSFVLHGKTEDGQYQRFKTALLPVLQHAFISWILVTDHEYIIRHNIDLLIRSLTWDMRKYLPLKKIIVPVKLFNEIETIMTENLSITDNYDRYTCWKLTTEYVKLVAIHKDLFSDPNLEKIPLTGVRYGWLPDVAEDVWKAVHIKISPEFGPIIVKQLKADTNKYFSNICWLFIMGFSRMFQNLSFQQNLMKMETLKYMIMNDDFAPSYIVVCEEMPVGKCCNYEEKKKLIEMLKILSVHPSLEVKMHYQKAFGDLTDTWK